MDVNSVTYQSGAVAYAAASGTAAAKVTDETKSTVEAESSAKAGGEAAVYEPSTKDGSKTTMSEADRKALVKQLKAELEQRQLQFINTVKDMLSKQGKAVTGDGFWRTIASGDYTVDDATRAEAQKNIAEDGYWGVEQTSDRIVKYATALSGGDPEKLDTMIAAFEKGYKAAEKAWGGALPGISEKTRTAVREKFDALKKQYAQGSDAD